MKKFTILTVTLFLLGAPGIPAAAEEEAAAAGGIAWIDLPRVMREYHRAKDLVEEFEKEKAAREAQIQELIDEIERLEGEMLLLSDRARGARAEEVMKKKIAVNRMIEAAERELSMQSMLRQEDLLEEISAAAETVARREGYAYVLRREVLLYQDPEREITDAVIEELNRKAENR